MMLSLDCAIELTMGRVTLEHVDHVVEGNEGTMSNVHFPRVKGSPSNQVHNTAKHVHSGPHHRVSGMRLVLHAKMRMSPE